MGDGGRTWWAHFAFTRIKSTPTILAKKIEDLRSLAAFFGCMPQCALRGSLEGSDGLPMSPRVSEVEAELSICLKPAGNQRLPRFDDPAASEAKAPA
jgi:hypothetical protein